LHLVRNLTNLNPFAPLSIIDNEPIGSIPLPDIGKKGTLFFTNSRKREKIQMLTAKGKKQPKT
jgi:hypothetical protein